MESKKVQVRCECEGTGYIAVADRAGEDTEYVECAAHHPAFKGPTIMEQFSVIEQQAQNLAKELGLEKCADCGELTDDGYRVEYIDNVYRCAACWETLAE